MLLSAAAAPASVSFGREVRPLLSDKCFKCHGPDDKTRAANFRLDIQEGALTKIKPGDPAASRLYIRVSNEKPALRMPPPQSGITLTPAEIDTLKRWIEQGAKWETHWAMQYPTGLKCRLVRTRSTTSFASGCNRTGSAVTRSGSRDPPATRKLRPHWPASHTRGNRGVPERPQPRRLREGR